MSLGSDCGWAVTGEGSKDTLTPGVTGPGELLSPLWSGRPRVEQLWRVERVKSLKSDQLLSVIALGLVSEWFPKSHFITHNSR